MRLGLIFRPCHKKTSSKGISTSKLDIFIFKLIFRLICMQKIFSRFFNKWETNQNSDKQTKMLTNTQNNWFKSLEALQIALKNTAAFALKNCIISLLWNKFWFFDFFLPYIGYHLNLNLECKQLYKPTVYRTGLLLLHTQQKKN